VVKFEDVADVKEVEAKVNVYVPAVLCHKFVNVATPLTAATVVVPPKVPPEAVTVTDAVEVVAVAFVESTIRTTGCVANAAPEVPPTGCVVTKIATAGSLGVAAVLEVAVPSPIAFTAFIWMLYVVPFTSGEVPLVLKVEITNGDAVVPEARVINVVPPSVEYL
jgi:hypothetical protein